MSLKALYVLTSLAFFLASAKLSLSNEEHQCKVQPECAGDHRGNGGGAGEEEDYYPFVFLREEFETQAVSGQSIFRMLPRFSERSNLFEGIKDYRVAFLQVESQTFVVPTHQDAELICTVVLGKGSVGVIREKEKESFNIYEGDVLRIPPGTTTYMVNTDNVKKVPLVFFILIRSISTPGRFEFFSGTTGKKPASFFRGFSPETLEEALNFFSGTTGKKPASFFRGFSPETLEEALNWEKIEEVLFGEAQEEGPFLKVTEEQLKSLSQEGDEGGIRPFRGDETTKERSINVFPHKTVSNHYGVIYEVGTQDFKPLHEVDVNVAFVNITQGGMLGPFFNSRATQVAVVLEGEGWLEMGSPKNNYEIVRSKLRTGMVVVIPQGYPYVNVATVNPSKSLQFGWFDINGKHNQRVTLTGNNNLFLKLGNTAKELSFGNNNEVVNDVFGSQPFELFFKAPPSSLNPDQ